MATQVFSPIELFHDVNGQPLDDGFIWIGQPNLDPETNPISVFFDDALTVPAAQPIRTRNGYPSNAGAQARLYVTATTYSILVKNKNGSQITSVTAIDSLRSDLANSSDQAKGAALIGYHSRTAHAKLDEFVHVDDFYTSVSTTDKDAFIAAHAALPAAGGNIRFSDGKTYTLEGVTLTKPNVRLSGMAKIVASAGSSVLPIVSYTTAGGIFQIEDLEFQGDKYNQTGALKQNVYAADAGRVYLRNVKSYNAKKNGFFFERCAEVIADHCEGRLNGLSIQNGDVVDVKGSGISTNRCDKVRIDFGTYQNNSYLGIRCNGYEEAFVAPVWAGTTAVTLGSLRRPTVGRGLYAECITAGTTAGVEPVWPATAGATIADGSAVWRMGDPLANDVQMTGVIADNQTGLFSEGSDNDFAIGITVASTRNVTLIMCRARGNRGNNIDFNRVWNGELYGCEGLSSISRYGFNPDYTGDSLGLAGGSLKVIGGFFNRNNQAGILGQFAYQGSTTPDYGDFLIRDVQVAFNGTAGMIFETVNNLTIKNSLFRDNGTTTQLFFGEAGQTANKPTYRSGYVEIDGNEFQDSRGVSAAAYSMRFGVVISAANPDFPNMVLREPKITNNKCTGFLTAAMKSDGPQRGGRDWFNYAYVRSNIGIETFTTFTQSAVVSNAVEVTNQDVIIMGPTAAVDIKTLSGQQVGQTLVLSFVNANCTIRDLSTPGGAGGNIQLTGNADLVPAANTFLRFLFINGAWWQQ